jgi:hypothetical protein
VVPLFPSPCREISRRGVTARAAMEGRCGSMHLQSGGGERGRGGLSFASTDEEGGSMQRVVGGHAGKRRDRGRWVEGNK